MKLGIELHPDRFLQFFPSYLPSPWEVPWSVSKVWVLVLLLKTAHFARFSKHLLSYKIIEIFAWFYLMIGRLIMFLLGLREFPEIIFSRFREFPGIREKIPGNSRESKIHYIGNEKHHFYYGNWSVLTFFGHIQPTCGHIHQRTLISHQKIFFEKILEFWEPKSQDFWKATNL